MRLEPLAPEQLSGDQRTLYDAITTGPRAGTGLTDDRGALRGPFDPLLRAPMIGDAVQRLGAVVRYAGALPDDLRELAILMAAGHWRCEFELAVHGRIAESVGVDAAVVAAIAAGEPVDLASGTAQHLVHAVALELFETRRLSDATYAALASMLGDEQIVELLVVFGYYSTLAMVMEAFEIS